MKKLTTITFLNLCIGNQFFWNFKFLILKVYNAKILLTDRSLLSIFTDNGSSKIGCKSEMLLPNESRNIKDMLMI